MSDHDGHLSEEESQRYSPSAYRGQYSDSSDEDGWVHYTPSNPYNDRTWQIRNGFMAVSLAPSDGPNANDTEPDSPPPPPPEDSDTDDESGIDHESGIDEDSEKIHELPPHDGTVGNPILVDEKDICVTKAQKDAIQPLKNLVESLREQVRDPVMFTIFKDPWIATDGHTYDLETIRNCTTSPLTREPGFRALRPNLFAKQTVELYKNCLKNLNNQIDSLFK